MIKKEDNMDNVISKFRTFWRGLSDMEQEDLWDVLACLRGCDSKKDLDCLKKFITARIRGALFGDDGLFGYFIYQSVVSAKRDCSSMYTEKDVVKALKKSPEHFQRHIVKGIFALEHCGVSREEIEDLLSVAKQLV